MSPAWCGALQIAEPYAVAWEAMGIGRISSQVEHGGKHRRGSGFDSPIRLHSIAQWVEQSNDNRSVAGSTPVGKTWFSLLNLTARPEARPCCPAHRAIHPPPDSRPASRRFASRYPRNADGMSNRNMPHPPLPRARAVSHFVACDGPSRRAAAGLTPPLYQGG